MGSGVQVQPHALATVGKHLGPFLRELRASLATYSDEELDVIARFLDASSELAMRHALALRDRP